MSPSRRAASRMPGCKGVALHWDIGALAHRLRWGVGAILRNIGALGGGLGGHLGNTAQYWWHWWFGAIRALGHRGIGTCKGHLLAA